MHRVRGASGDVLARGPGFPPDLSPARPPRPLFPPLPKHPSSHRERVWSPRRQREGVSWPKARFGSGGSRAPGPAVLRPPSRPVLPVPPSSPPRDEEELQNLEGEQGVGEGSDARGKDRGASQVPGPERLPRHPRTFGPEKTRRRPAPLQPVSPATRSSSSSVFREGGNRGRGGRAGAEIWGKARLPGQNISRGTPDAVHSGPPSQGRPYSPPVFTLPETLKSGKGRVPPLPRLEGAPGWSRWGWARRRPRTGSSSSRTARPP